VTKVIGRRQRGAWRCVLTVLMMETPCIVISPEGCASIMWASQQERAGAEP